MVKAYCCRKRGGLPACFVFATGLLAFVGEPRAAPDATRDAQGHPVSIAATAFQPRAGTEDVPFTRYDGSLFGLHRENSFSPRDFYPPFFNGGGISSGDIDRDGWPDVVSANGALIVIYMNEEGQRFVPLEVDVSGQDDAMIFNVALVDIDGDAVLSSTAFFGDIDRDGDLDLIVGNDFEDPDIYYRGDRKGGFELIERRDGIIPYSTQSTMSIDTGDFDNDLDLDIFVDQITARATGPSAQVQMLALEHYCDDIVVQAVRDRCRANMATREGFFYGANHQPQTFATVPRCPTRSIDKLVRACKL